MNTKMPALIILLSLSVLICSCQFETPHPAKWGGEYLKAMGASDEIIDKITKRKDMSRDEFKKYYKCDDVNVRHLIASNTHIPSDLLSELVKDKNGFVRNGAAYNTSITKDMIDVLKNDSTYSVRASLVTNPFVPEDVILMIYETNKKHLMSPCARNPNCPQAIKDDILKSNDESAKHWLKTGEEKKRAGVGVQRIRESTISD